MPKFNSFYDSLQNGVLGPKGNMADWQHASRLYVADNQKYAPKVKFLYHVTFYLTETAKRIIPEVWENRQAINMLVKSVDLPKFTAQVETKNKYNRKKNIQTRLDYDPINIDFFDDSYGATTALLESYYKYYFADGTHSTSSRAYGDRLTGDTLYDGESSNSFKFGMDNNIPAIPFFDKIEISQMSKKSYTKYTLINPIVASWSHDSLDNSDNGTPMQNSITVQYDTVFYDRGDVEAGPNGDPAGFGTPDHYDTTPSPISLLGGGTLGIDGIFGAGIDLYDYITKGKNFDNPFEAAIAAVNLVGNVRNLDSDSLRAGGFKILSGAINDVAGIDVSGVSQTFFPKNGGNGGDRDLLVASAALAGLSALSSTNSQSATGDENPQQKKDSGFQKFQKEYQNSGGTGGMNGARDTYNALPSSERAKYEG